MVLKMPRFLPKDQKFFDLLENSAKNLLKGAEALQDLVHDYVDVEAKLRRIKEIEHDGDAIIHDIMDKLDKTFITPIDREEIHILASELTTFWTPSKALPAGFTTSRFPSQRPSASG